MDSTLLIGNSNSVWTKLRRYWQIKYQDLPAADSDWGINLAGIRPDDFEHRLTHLLQGRLHYYSIGENLAVPVAFIPNNLARGRVMVIAGIHGNEYAGPYALLEFLQRLSSSHPEIIAVLTANPAGFKQRWRRNGEGVDLNRDFYRFQTVETKLIKKLVSDMRPDLVISLREGPLDGYAATLSNHAGAEWDLAVGEVITRVGLPLVSRHPLWNRELEVPGLINYRLGTAMMSRICRFNTLDEYLYFKGIPLITTESGWREPFASRVAAHRQFLSGIVEKW